MKPGGTGRPSLVISARPAPFPPSTILFPPSASSKKYIGLTVCWALPKRLSSDITRWSDLSHTALKCCVYINRRNLILDCPQSAPCHRSVIVILLLLPVRNVYGFIIN